MAVHGSFATGVATGGPAATTAASTPATECRGNMPETARDLVTLVWCDGPQVILMEQKNRFIIGVAIDEPGFRYPMFAAAVPVPRWKEYLCRQRDLRSLFVDAERRFLFDYYDFKKDEVTMQIFEDEPPERFLPLEGFRIIDHPQAAI